MKERAVARRLFDSPTAGSPPGSAFVPSDRTEFFPVNKKKKNASNPRAK